MSWGVSYKYDGYLSHMTTEELEDKLEENKQLVDMIKRELIAYVAATPPAMAKDEDGNEYPHPEFAAMKVNKYWEELFEYMWEIHHIEDCLEALQENPEDVKNA